jgi:hypothetical protein
MGMRRNKKGVEPHDPKLGADLPPLEFKGKREAPRKGQKRRDRDAGASGRRSR